MSLWEWTLKHGGAVRLDPFIDEGVDCWRITYFDGQQVDVRSAREPGQYDGV